MDRRLQPYAPLRAGRRPRWRRHLLRTARLNAAGRAALVGGCAAAGGLGWALGRLPAVPAGLSVPVGGLLPLLLVVGADRRRWRAMRTGYGWGGTPDQVAAVVADLAERGVRATTELSADGTQGSLRYRNADARAVRVVLAEHGVVAPLRPPAW